MALGTGHGRNTAAAAEWMARCAAVGGALLYFLDDLRGCEVALYG